MKWLSGKKTYIIGIVMAILAGLDAAGVVPHEVVLKIEAILGALGLMTLRAGVTKSS